MPSPYRLRTATADPSTPPLTEPSGYPSGMIVSGAPGSTRIIPSPSKRAAGGVSLAGGMSTPPRGGGGEYHSGVIHSRSLGYNVITPLDEVKRGGKVGGKKPAAEASPLPSSRHPIRASGDGCSTASFVYDGERGVEGVPPRASGIASGVGENGEHVSASGLPPKEHSGRIVSSAYGYTKVVPSPAKLRAMLAEEDARKSRGPPSSAPYVSSPIRSTSAGSTNAGSIMAATAHPSSSGSVPVPTSPPENYLPHGTIRYVQDKSSPLATYVAPADWEKHHAPSSSNPGSQGYVSPARHNVNAPPNAPTAQNSPVIRATFPGYTTASM